MTERGPDLTASTAGTHVIEHAGRLLALCEANLPFELTPTSTPSAPTTSTASCAAR